MQMLKKHMIPAAAFDIGQMLRQRTTLDGTGDLQPSNIVYCLNIDRISDYILQFYDAGYCAMMQSNGVLIAKYWSRFIVFRTIKKVAQ